MHLPSLLDVPPTFQPPSHPPRSSQSTELSCQSDGAVSHYCRFYTWEGTYINPNLPGHPSSLPPDPVSTWAFSTPVPLFLPWKQVHLYHSPSFYTHVSIYDIGFSLSDLLHSVLHTLGSAVSLLLAQFHSFLWLSNIPLYICMYRWKLHVNHSIVFQKKHASGIPGVFLFFSHNLRSLLNCLYKTTHR